VKTNTADLRIMTYNTHNDSLFEKTDTYSRILNALGPDILNFQEIYNHTGVETATLISQILPPESGEQWYYAQGADCVTISRFGILNTWNLDGNLVSLIAAPASLPTSNILLINAHPPCCTDDSGRQLEIDHIMSFIRDAKTGGGSVTLQKNTPIIIVGDMNFVGLSQQLKTLLTGDIVNESQYGTDFQPDWDATALSDCISTHNSSRAAYTWRSDTSDYPPGRLDYIIYTDSVIQTSHHFILWTPDMTPEELIQYGLNADDTASASDHLPHVADFHTPMNLWMLW
jgi:endonuclease/exonuclease/phosphatase family metal-dependent hydrolase